jgi:Flp pilus assembly protein TadG
MIQKQGMLFNRTSSIKQVLRNSRLGSAAVEFAVIAPLFFLLLAGIIEFGTAFRIQHCLSAAARQGARAAIIDGSTSSQITQKVRDNCVKNLKVGPADVIVAITINGQSSIDLSQASEGTEIQVTVGIPYSKAGVGFYANTFANSVLSSSCTLEKE